MRVKIGFSFGSDRDKHGFREGLVMVQTRFR